MLGFGLFGPFAMIRTLMSLISVVTLAFAIYVALDEDLRTVVWDKWTGDISFEWPGGDRNIGIKIDGFEFPPTPAPGS